MASREDVELQIILAEYEYHKQQVQDSLTTVNTSINLLLVALTVLLSLAALVAKELADDARSRSLALAAVSLGASIAIILTFARTFKARLQQTDAERALSRIRRYFVTRAPELTDFISDRTYDDWPTPYTARFGSMTYRGWVALIALGSTAFALAVFFAVDAVASGSNTPAAVSVAVVFGLASAAAQYADLERRVGAKRASDRPRFPRTP